MSQQKGLQSAAPIAICLWPCTDASSGIVTNNDVVNAVDDRISGLFTYSGISTAGCVTIERVIPHGRVFGARRVQYHGVITKRIIFVAVHIGLRVRYGHGHC